MVKKMDGKKNKTYCLIDEMQQLKTVIQEKDKKTEELERRLNELEQYTSMDDLVVSGFVTTYCSYARDTAGDKGRRCSTSC